jgi:hypothetical protein
LGSLPAGVIAVEHEHDLIGACQPCDLDRGNICAEQSHSGWHTCLGEAHDGPGALDKHEPILPKMAGTVSVEQHLGFGHTAWETPLPVAPDILLAQTPSGVPEWSPCEIVQAHGDGATEECACCRVSGFEIGGSIDGDELFPLQEVGGGIQGDPPTKRPKWRVT